MNTADEAQLLATLGRIADALEKIAGHLQPATGTTSSGRQWTLTIADTLDRIGDKLDAIGGE